MRRDQTATLIPNARIIVVGGRLPFLRNDHSRDPAKGLPSGRAAMTAFDYPNKSRNHGTSGKSAGGIGYFQSSVPLTHLISCPSRGLMSPSQVRHI
jgi:hypothetical protein